MPASNTGDEVHDAAPGIACGTSCTQSDPRGAAESGLCDHLASMPS